MFLAGFILGRLSTQKNTPPTPHRVDDNCKYSCNWWIEQLGVDCSKQKISTLLIRNEKIIKEENRQGLTIFIPQSNEVFDEIKSYFK